MQMSDPQAYEAQLASIVERWARESDVDEDQARRMLEPQLLSDEGAGMVAPQELGTVSDGAWLRWRRRRWR
jgi:hypothetical protein